MGTALVPSGASTGAHEAVELRDGDAARYGGKGVLNAVRHVNETIRPGAPRHRCVRPGQPRSPADRASTAPRTSRSSAPTRCSGVSLAVAHAAAESVGLPLYRYLGGAAARTLPVPLVNILNGGKHAIDSTDFQEFMIAPLGAPTFREGLRWAVETFHALGALLHEERLRDDRRRRGRLRPEPRKQRGRHRRRAHGDRASGLRARRADRDRARPGHDRALRRRALHPGPRGPRAQRAELIDFWADWVDRYPIVSIEDGLAEDDWEGWTAADRAPGRTDPARRRRPAGDEHERLARAIRERAANSILVKLNQIGTLTETIEAVEMAQRAGWTAIISHRSGETEDTTIADLAVALNIGPDQDRLDEPLGADREVQPPAAHRGGARRRGRVRRSAGVRRGPWLTPSTFGELAAALAQDRHEFAEFFRGPSGSLSLTVARWPAGSVDDQQPHTEDEVYYVVAGRAQLTVNGEPTPVESGSVAFVAAGGRAPVHRDHGGSRGARLLVAGARDGELALVLGGVLGAAAGGGGLARWRA